MKLACLWLVLLPAIALAANNDDWPMVAEECKAVVSPPAGPPPPPNFLDRLLSCGAGFFTARPIHPTVGSVVPGGGFGPGVTFDELFNRGRWQQDFGAAGAVTTREFWLGEVKFTASHDKFGRNNSARDRFAYDIYAHARGLPLMPFYGIGPDTAKSGLVDFKERDVAAGADVFNPFSDWFGAGGRIETMWTDIAGITDPTRISITSRFNETTAPGLLSQPNLMHYEIYAEPRWLHGLFPFDYKVGYNFYEDHDTGRYSFQRFRVNGIHTFHPTGRDQDFLTIHTLLSLAYTNGSSVVPFYLQETLGGTDIDGNPTLRGFADYRFRAPDLDMIQVEYDQRVWGPLGLLAFYDVGQVALKASDLSFAHMRQSFGFGVAAWAGNRAVFKVYLGLGSGEGAHTFIGIPAF